jgi:hypothetical protein
MKAELREAGVTDALQSVLRALIAGALSRLPLRILSLMAVVAEHRRRLPDRDPLTVLHTLSQPGRLPVAETSSFVEPGSPGSPTDSGMSSPRSQHRETESPTISDAALFRLASPMVVQQLSGGRMASDESRAVVFLRLAVDSGVMLLYVLGASVDNLDPQSLFQESGV